MNFLDEIKDYSYEDLDLIIASQRELYSDDEWDALLDLYEKKKRIKQDELEARLPKTIPCVKCDGPNPFSNDTCCFCGCKLEKTKYYKDEYYETKQGEQTSSEEESYTFQYIISFLIPLIGFISGAIMLASDDYEKRSCGKICIAIGLVSTVVSTILGFVLFG
ncbi:MAG: hypothetical protein IKV01_03595 [Clostridia bacterium]|nr:hypothetical protein [Clostridia bacterium]